MKSIYEQNEQCQHLEPITLLSRFNIKQIPEIIEISSVCKFITFIF